MASIARPSNDAIALVGRTRIAWTLASFVTMASAMPTPRWATSVSGDSTDRSGRTASAAVWTAGGASTGAEAVDQRRTGASSSAAAIAATATTAATVTADLRRGLAFG